MPKKMPKSVKAKEKIDSDETIELLEHRAMIYLPEDVVEATIVCKVFMYGDVHKVEKRLTMADIREAFKKADDGYIDDDDVFTITDEGRAYFEEMKKSGRCCT